MSSIADFPDTDTALEEPNGLLAMGGDLSPGRLLEAYARGIFPWCSEPDPILWWTPDPRMVLYPACFHASKSLKKSIKKQRFEISLNGAFEDVMAACAGARQASEGTWISPDMQSAYSHLHTLGLAHSLEVRVAGEIVGGLYGVCLDRVFFGESMFSTVTDASKTALFALAAVGQQGYFDLIDCQVYSQHLARLGAEEIARKDFETVLSRAINSGYMTTARTAVSRCVALEPAKWQQALPRVASDLLL